MSLRRYNFVVFSDDWGRHPSSCQHLFGRLARDHRVLWVNTLGLRQPKADAFTMFRGVEKLREWTRPLRQVGPSMWVLAPVMLPLVGPGPLGRANSGVMLSSLRRTMGRLGITHPILWATVPTACDYVGRLGESAVVYYVTDDYSLWPGGNAAQIRQADRQLTRSADLILACNTALQESHRSPTAETILLPHAVDFEHFARPGLSEPDDLAGIPRPRACFFGLIYEKIDLDALAELAQSKRDLQLVMIGPVAANVDRLKALPNVHFLGPRPYRRLPAYLGAMDVLVVPYVLDEETRNKGPLKIRECLATGKPTVARAIPDLEEMADVLHLYSSAGGLTPAVGQALRNRSQEWSDRMRQKVRDQTWEARAEEVLRQLDGLFAPPEVQAPPGGLGVSVSASAAGWESYLGRKAESTIYHDPAWAQVMEKAYGNTPIYLTARQGGRIAGVLQLVEQRSLLFGSHLCSLPYFDAAGVLADDPSTAAALVAEARKVAEDRNVAWAELRQMSPVDPALPTRTDKVTLRLSLPEKADELWEGLKAKVRNQVRKAQKADLEVEQCGRELLRDFYGVYVRNMRDLGSPPHSLRFFELLLDHFGPAVRLFVVRLGERPAAASLTLTDRHAVHVPWAGSDWRLRDLNANMLLYWSMLSDACDHRAGCFDFGRSTRDCGTYRFKTQWGAEEVPLYWQYLLPAGREMPGLRPDSPRYRLMVACWRRLPVPLVRVLGPPIIAKLS